MRRMWLNAAICIGLNPSSRRGVISSKSSAKSKVERVSGVMSRIISKPFAIPVARIVANSSLPSVEFASGIVTDVKIRVRPSEAAVSISAIFSSIEVFRPA